MGQRAAVNGRHQLPTRAVRELEPLSPPGRDLGDDTLDFRPVCKLETLHQMVPLIEH
jgi:hypothetical protein